MGHFRPTVSIEPSIPISVHTGMPQPALFAVLNINFGPETKYIHALNVQFNPDKYKNKTVVGTKTKVLSIEKRRPIWQ